MLGVVNNGTQTQIIIGAEVNNVYKDFYCADRCGRGSPIDENLDLKDELKNKKGKLLTRFFETVARYLQPHRSRSGRLRLPVRTHLHLHGAGF